MSHTTEQARELWCPMVRVVQIGATETTSTYNRVLAKHHVPVNLADPDDGGKAMQAAILKSEVQMSQASRCIADKCAMWRWVPGGLKSSAGDRQPTTRGYCGLAGRPEVMP